MKRAWVAAAVFVVAVVGFVVAALLWLDDPAPRSGPFERVPDAAEVALEARAERVRRGEPSPEQVAAEGARVFGRVARPDGAAVAGAEIAVWTRGEASPRLDVDRFGSVNPEDGPPLPGTEAPGRHVASATAGDDGTYAVEGLEPGAYALLVTDPEGRAASRAIDLPEGLPEVRADVVVAVGGWDLDVRVRRADGRPFRGMVGVEAHPAFATAPAVRWRPVDAAGNVRFVGLELRTLRLVAAGDDAWHERSNVIGLPLDGAYEWVLGAGMEEVRGTVTDVDTAAPVVGARVRARDDRGLRAAWTDASGRFALPGGRSGTLRVTADGYSPAVGRFGEERAVDVVLAGCGIVEGRVARLSDGEPIGGTTVWAGDWHDPDTPRAVTDEQGRYRVEGVSTGRVWMRVHGAGWVTPEERGRASWRAAEVATGAVARCDLVAMKTGRIAGRVTGPDGRGVAGAYVAVGERDMQHTQRMQDVATVTDVDGYYVLDGITKSNQPIWLCRADGFPILRGDAPRTYAGGTNRLDIELPAPLWLDVTVVTEPGGEPVSGALATVKRMEPGLGHHPVATAATDSAGRARLGPLAAGRHWLSASAPGLTAPRHTGIDVDADGQEIVLPMTPALSVAGTLFCDGTPVAYELVRIYTVGFSSAARTDTEGRFRFGEVLEGEVVLRAEVGDLVADARVPAGTEDVRLELVEPPPEEPDEEKGPTARIVVRTEDGELLPHFRWMVVQERGGSWRTYRNRGHAGAISYEVDPDLPERSLILWDIRDAGWRLGTPYVVALPIPDGPPETFECTVPAVTSAITGRVVDLDGNVVPGGRVHAVPGDSDREDDLRRQTIATFPVGPDGSFRVEGFGTETVRLAAEPPPTHGLSRYVDAAPGDADVELRVAPAVRAVITVVDEDGAPVADVDVYVSDDMSFSAFEGKDVARMGVEGFTDEDVIAHGRTGSDGRCVFERLDASRPLRLSVSPPRRGLVVDRDDREDWVPADTTVVLRSEGTVSGSVRLADGTPAGSAMVYVVRGDHASGSGVRDDGTFVIPRIAAGDRVKVFAMLPGGTRSELAEAGTDAPVSLVIDPGAFVLLRLEGEVPEFGPEVWIAPDPYDDRPFPLSLHRELLLSELDSTRTYTVFVGPTEDGLCALLEGVVADGGVREVTLAKGHPVRGRLLPPESFRGALEVRLARGEKLFAAAELNHSTHEFSFAGVPAGAWTLVVRRWNRDEVLARRDVRVPVGGAGPIEIAWE